MFRYLTQIFKEEQHASFVRKAAEDKAKLTWMKSFVRGIPANMLICTAIQMGISVCIPACVVRIYWTECVCVCVCVAHTNLPCACLRPYHEHVHMHIHLWHTCNIITQARDMLGKVTVLHFPLTAYTIAGFEHSITNLVVVPMGVMYGANVSIGPWIWNNLIPAALGNMIGGGIIVGGFVTLLYSWYVCMYVCMYVYIYIYGTI